jgi:hypothetical protein
MAVQGSSSGDDRQTDDVDDFAPIRGLHTDGRAGVVGDWGRARLGDGRRKNPQRATVRLLIEALALAPEQAEALELAARPRPPLRRSK